MSCTSFFELDLQALFGLGDTAFLTLCEDYLAEALAEDSRAETERAACDYSKLAGLESGPWWGWW